MRREKTEAETVTTQEDFIEIYGARVSRVQGGISGNASDNIFPLDSSNDGVLLNAFYGRYFICDTATAFGVTIVTTTVTNQHMTFRNIGARVRTHLFSLIIFYWCG